MTPINYTCLACARALPAGQFSPNQIHAGAPVICIHCEALPAAELVMLVRATVSRDLVHQRETAAGRRESRRLAKLAKYAETGKRCADCHAWKPVADYDQCDTRPDGLQASCRVCRKLYVTLRAQGGLALWRTTRDALRHKSALSADKKD